MHLHNFRSVKRFWTTGKRRYINVLLLLVLLLLLLLLLCAPKFRDQLSDVNVSENR